MSNQPLDKGRAVVVADRYQTGQNDQFGNPETKARYATVGRATMWPAKEGAVSPRVDIEIDTMPVGVQGPVKVIVFWDSDNQSQQQGNYQPQQQMQQQQPQQQGYQQQPQNNYANHRG
jgi:hypothetical protein